MLTINFKQIYETNEFGKNQWVLILYNISANHYIGIPVYSKEKKECVFLESIQKYADVNSIKDYNKTKMIKCVYIKGKPLKISNSDFNKVIRKSKSAILSYLDKNVKNDIEGLNYLKWCKDKLNLELNDLSIDKLKQHAIYWVNLGSNVGSELRKLRPVILWRSTADKKMWTMIPLTTKKRNDQYYFHYDLECISEGSAKVENIMNYSYKRILAPYFSKNKLAILTKKDYDNLCETISRYYLYK